MADRLQIGFEANLDNDAEMEIRVTPADLTNVPPKVIQAARTLIGYFDLFDVQPGDGEADFAVGDLTKAAPKGVAPVLSGILRFANGGKEVAFKGNIFLKVKDRA